LGNSPRGEPEDEDPMIFESLSEGLELRKHVEKATGFLDNIRKGYRDDPLFTKVVKDPSRYATFSARDGLFYTKNRGGLEVLCIP
jgi:hypothetical protein